MPPGAAASRRRTAQRHLLGSGSPDGRVVIDERQNGPALLRVVHSLSDAPKVSVIVPTRDRADLMRMCADGVLHRTDYPNIELLVIDNDSAQPDAVALLADLASDLRVRVLAAPGPFNWSALNNAGVEAARGEVVVLLNNDIDVIDPGWLREIASQAMRYEVGVVGAKLLYPDGGIQHAGVALGPAGRATHVWRHSPGDAPGYLDTLAVVRQVTAMTGACLALRRAVYLAAGGCAEELSVTWNDVDLCLRVRALGLRAIWTPHARLLHLEQASRGTDEIPERQERYRRERDWMRARWGTALDDDAFFSPHLRRSEDPRETEPRLAV
jgi:GT2 family glycosyltransferase